MYLTDTDYPALRSTLAPEYIELSDEQLDALVAQLYGEGAAAEDVENFLRSLGRGFKQVAGGVGRFAQKVGPGIAQGAISGAGVGGPFGAIAGALAGGAGSALSRSGNPTLRGIGGAIGGVTQLASQFSPTGRLGQLAGVGLGALGQVGRRGGGRAALGQLAGGAMNLLGAGGGAPANALLGLLSRPETMRALGAAAMAPAGRSMVQVGAQPVAVQSILNAIGSLAGRAAREMESESGAALPAWYYGADGELAIDPGDGEQRTDALLELFSQTPSPHGPPAWHESEAESDAAWQAWPVYTAADAERDRWLLASEAMTEGDADGFHD